MISVVDFACFYFALEDVQLEALKATKEGVGHNIYHSYSPAMGRWDVLFPALTNNSRYHFAAFHMFYFTVFVSCPAKASHTHKKSLMPFHFQTLQYKMSRVKSVAKGVRTNPPCSFISGSSTFLSHTFCVHTHLCSQEPPVYLCCLRFSQRKAFMTFLGEAWGALLFAEDFWNWAMQSEHCLSLSWDSSQV